ncbi:uncharacterized protein LOC142786763 isoform X2 [Rhipicephalus microplus]|uniref:uncharacterized protein LOC142786763 isoform X2 n=1 Tax=Rhipicephalus microplus TaxID=6941 RepID=UPI003F6C3699
MEREVVVDFAAGWNKHIVNTSSAICKPVRSSDKGLCMHQRADKDVPNDAKVQKASEFCNEMLHICLR